MDLPPGQLNFQDEQPLAGGHRRVWRDRERRLRTWRMRCLWPTACPSRLAPLYYITSNEETQKGGGPAPDFTGDGVPDLVVTNRGSNTFRAAAGRESARTAKLLDGSCLSIRRFFNFPPATSLDGRPRDRGF